MKNAWQRHKRKVFNALRILVSVVLIALIVRSVDLATLWDVLQSVDPWYLAAALVVSMLGVAVRAVRWQILLRDQAVSASLGELTVLWFVSFLFTNLLPSGIGGDAIKAYELSRSTGQSAQVISTVLVDRFMGLFALQAIALVALLFSWWLIPSQIAIFTVVIFGVSLLVAWLISAKPLWDGLARRLPLFARLLAIRPIRALVSSLQSYSSGALVRAFGVGVSFNILLIAMNVLLGSALRMDLPLAYYLIFVPITSVVLIAPISFAGLGVREGAYVYLFTQAGAAQAVALSLSLLVYVIGTVAPGVIGGVAYLLRGARSYRVVEEN